MWAGGYVAFRGSKIPANKRAHEKAAAMAKPGMNEPDMSRSPPTSIGDTNIAKPEKVRSEPQTTATLSGVMPTICMGRVSNWGTYTQEPMPMTTTAG